MKKISRSDQIGDGGIALIHRLVNEIGFIWHERQTDAGIDGEIELRNSATGEVANRFILVQSKAKNQSFPGESDISFYFICDAADIDYWMQAQDPVLLICSHPNTGEAWWMHLQPWFADPERRRSRKVIFNKRTQKLEPRAEARLLDLADPHGYAHVPVPQQLPETLVSNLVPVTLPETIYHAKTDVQDRPELLRRLHSPGERYKPRGDFIIRGHRLYAWRPFEESALQPHVKGPVDQLDPREWVGSAEADKQRWLVELLNYALRSDLAKDCRWHPGRKIVYWRPTTDLKPRKIRSATGYARQVFRPMMKKAEPDQVSYYWHAGLGWQFLDIEGTWHCALIPTVHYTRNGFADSLFIAEYLTGIKQREKNLAVRGQTQMWAQILSDTSNVFEVRDPILRYGPLVAFHADQGIDDEGWKPEVSDSSPGTASSGNRKPSGTKAEPGDANQPPLFKAA
ncbi:DUF4365 domain-containing protein [Glycomyces sp. L485]|uniref:DUF4365 domain-containing protein n=1 Tax=Glycomyces sp. L485 TaxID=2909235 RepID=UPI001F4AFF6E|nr:DUF4365 domain-containing protein [Glycomyces sp. L485]MCH7229949.1 DUF4365 domain-containing protein [Glycomyces sp. L485]